MFHRAVNKFQNKWHWNEELNKFWGDVVQGGRNILGSRYGESEVFLRVFFLSWVGRGSYIYHKLCQRLLLLSTGKAENE